MSSNIDKLKERNRQELETLDEPYQLKTYAIPEKYWKIFLDLMQSNLPLLPQIAEELRYNSSEHTLDQSTRAIQFALTELSKQAGNRHDENRYRAAGPLPRPRRKLTGFMALYYKYLYLLGAIRRKKAPGRIPYSVRADVIKLENYRRQFLFLYQNGIGITAQLDAFMERAEAKAEAITTAHRPLYTERKEATDEGERAGINEKTTAANSELRELRKDITICKRIRETAPAVRDNTLSAEETERQEQQKAAEHRQEKRPERKRPDL